MIKYDFVIIGAGVSGLYLANEFNRLNKSYFILEARNQSGGRIHTHYEENLTFELGAARILSNHKKVLNLAKKLSLELEEQYHSESAIFWDDRWYESTTEIIPNEKYPNPITLFGELLETTGICDLNSFENQAPKEWDEILTLNWLEQKGVPFEWAKLFFIGDIDVNLEQITLYESMFFYLVNLSDKEDNIYRIKNGMSQLINELRRNVNKVSFNQEVLKIEPNSSGYNVITSQDIIEAKNVVFTCSLTALSKIELPDLAKKFVVKWLNIGHYGASLKGHLTLKINVFPTLNNLISDLPIRFIRRGEFKWEFYSPSLFVNRDYNEIKLLLSQYFGEYNILELQIKNYHDAPYYGCYWNYKKGNFHRIFEASKTSKLMNGIFSIGEHFSLNPNWIEGSLESTDRFLNEL
jgi:monoamine oxidase